MTRLDTISVALEADIADFKRSMQEAGNIVGQQSTGMLGNLTKVSQGFFFVTQAAGTIAAAGREVYEFGQAIFDLGADAEETASKFSATLGPATERAQKFLEGFANTAGLTITEGRELIATTTGIAMGFGFAQEDAAAFSEEVLTLAGDMTSYTNIPMEETSRAVQSALAGERESLKRLGIVIRETDVQQRALAMTGKDNAKALNDQEKATATLALIQERANYMAGNLEMTQSSAANTARRLGAEFRQMREVLARSLTPALTEIMIGLADAAGGDGMEGFVEAIVGARDQIAAWARVGVEAVQGLAIAFGNIVQIVFDLGQGLYAVAEGLANLATLNFSEAARSFRKLKDEGKDILQNVEDIIGGFDGLGGAIDEAMRTGKADVETFMRGINEADKQVIDHSESIEQLAQRHAQVTEEIDGMVDSYLEGQGAIQRKPINIVFGDMTPEEIGQAFYEDVQQTYAVASAEIERNKGIRDAMAANAIATYEFREKLQDMSRVGGEAIGRLIDHLGDVVPALEPVGRGVKSFIDDLAQGAPFAEGIGRAIGAIKTGGLSLLIDTAVGVLGDMFSRDSRATQRAQQIHDALRSNEQAIRQNTESQLRVITGGVGGGTVSDILAAMQVAFGGGTFDPFDPRFAGIAGQFFETPMQMFMAILENMGLSFEDVERLAEELNISLDGGTASIEQFMRLLGDLVGNQLSAFQNAFENMIDLFDLRGIVPEEQVGGIIDFLSGQVGPDLAALLESLATASPEEAGNIIADIIENIRAGGEFYAQLGGIASEEFIAVLQMLFGLIEEAATGIEGEDDIGEPSVPDDSTDDGTVNEPFDDTEGTDTTEPRPWEEEILELQRISYDAIIQRMTSLEAQVDTLIGTNRNGFDDVAAAIRT